MSTNVQTWMQHHGDQLALINDLVQMIVWSSSAIFDDDNDRIEIWSEGRNRSLVYGALIQLITIYVFKDKPRKEKFAPEQSEFEIAARKFFSATLLKRIEGFATTKTERHFLLMTFARHLAAEQLLVTEKGWYQDVFAEAEQ